MIRVNAPSETTLDQAHQTDRSEPRQRVRYRQAVRFGPLHRRPRCRGMDRRLGALKKLCICLRGWTFATLSQLAGSTFRQWNKMTMGEGILYIITWHNLRTSQCGAKCGSSPVGGLHAPPTRTRLSKSIGALVGEIHNQRDSKWVH